MGPAAGVVSAIFLAFGGAVSYRMHLLLGLFQIPESQVVTGAVQVNSPNESGAAIDLSSCSAFSLASQTASCCSAASTCAPGGQPR